jgi:ABC-type amino acid transport substrate-binding protein
MRAVVRNVVIGVLASSLPAFLDPVAVRAEDNPKPLVFCAEPTSMPRTAKEPDGAPKGLDVAVARLICKQLGRPLEMHWCSSPSCSRRCLRDQNCDVILGHPVDEGAPKDIAWSVPYAGGQFSLVVARGSAGIRSLADLVGKRVGIVTGTVALPEDKYTLVRFRTREDVLDQFTAEKLDGAFLDGDFSAWYLHAHSKLELRLVSDYVPREHWNMALAVRAASGKLLTEINKGLAELAESGELKKAYAELGVPYRTPFTGTAGKSAPVDAWKRIRDRGELRIAMDPANLPYSSAKEDRPGFDVELAGDLARLLGVKLRLVWLDIHRETAMGKLLSNESDLCLGAAIDDNAVEDDDELADKIIYSRPYYGSGYLLLGRQKGPRVKSLAELKGDRSRRLGTEAGSVADYRLRQRGYLRTLYRNQLAVLKALDDGLIDFAYSWANVGWLLHATPEFKLEILPGYVPEDHWNIAVAMRKHDVELQRHVNEAIDKLLQDGTVARSLARYHMPYYPPFEERKEGADAGVIRHQVADRGLEPQMQKLQTSRHPYGGLERIHSAGALVVGLDPKNLPFSTAHPEPAGLDYDIAGLLAAKLGVSLRVYWAPSAHDSYPSKLATKKFCDAMLSVMPDDRFSDRVLYSRPYCMAGYRLVVPTGVAAPSRLEEFGDERLAIEAGVAARGLQGRKTRGYPDLGKVLEAVASRDVAAGYVISTRGPWLAETLRPGKLRFLDGAAEDRFPICVAVRKSDRDLKAAIDVALQELAASGKLADVFARYHIPYTAAPRGDHDLPARKGGGGKR